MLAMLLFAAFSGFSTYQPITLATPVPHPPKPPCRVTLFENRAFLGDAPFLGPYLPKCTGPWARVVLHLNTRIKGMQYDRMGALWLNRSELLRFTTAEPTKHGIAYSVQKDVTAYAALFRAPGSVVAELANYVDKQDDGIYYLDAYLDFYRASRANPAPMGADGILPIDNELSAVPWSTGGMLTDRLAPLPRNIVAAQLDLYASNHGCDEFWYTNVPDAYAARHKADGLCGGGTYREIDVAIDGRPASVVYPFPYIWTGGINPLLWRPLSAIDTLNVPAYRVDLDPWAGVLSDGKPHTVTLAVFDNRGLWPMDANLLLWRDRRAARTGGKVVEDTIAPTHVITRDGLDPKGGRFGQSAVTNWIVKGYVVTSAGAVRHSIRAGSSFSNHQRLNFSTGEQDASQDEYFTFATLAQSSKKTVKSVFFGAYQLSANSVYPPLAAGSPFALIVRAGVQQRRTLVAPGRDGCDFVVRARALLQRRKDGRRPIQRGDTFERSHCWGVRNSVRWARAHNGAITSGNISNI